MRYGRIVKWYMKFSGLADDAGRNGAALDQIVLGQYAEEDFLAPVPLEIV